LKNKFSGDNLQIFQEGHVLESHGSNFGYVGVTEVPENKKDKTKKKCYSILRIKEKYAHKWRSTFFGFIFLYLPFVCSPAFLLRPPIKYSQLIDLHLGSLYIHHRSIENEIFLPYRSIALV
jgi:hypothetical protein